MKTTAFRSSSANATDVGVGIVAGVTIAVDAGVSIGAMIGAGDLTTGVTGVGSVNSVTESGNAGTGDEVRSGADTNRWGCDPGAG